MAFRLHRLGFMEATSLSELAAGAYGEAIDLQVTNLTGFVDGVLKAVKGIHGDRGLNVGGTADRLFDLGLQNHKKLSTMAERGRKGLDAALASDEALIPDKIPVPAGTDVVKLQRSIEYAEIRRMLATLPKPERAAEIQSAAERGDKDLMLAVEAAAPFVRDRLVDEDVLGKAREVFLEVTQPEKYRRLETTREALSTYQSNVARARKLLGEATGTPQGEAAIEHVIAAAG